MNKKIFFISFLIFVVIISAINIFLAIKGSFVPVKAAFGISPPYAEADNLHPGDNTVEYITIMRSNVAQEVPVKMTLKAPNFDTWIELIPKNLIFKKGESQVILGIKINVPKNAKAGLYTGKLFLSLGPDKKNGVAVALGGLINVKLRVVK